MQRHDLPPDGNIDAASTSRIVEDLREHVVMYFKTVYDEKIVGLLNMETKCNGLQCQTDFADIVRELIHVTFSIADSLYEIGKGKSGPRM